MRDRLTHSINARIIYRVGCLSAARRTARLDSELALFLITIAGAVNAAGFVAIEQYTSHMTGLFAVIAGHIVNNNAILAASALIGVITFIAGSAITTVIVQIAKKKQLYSRYALPLLIEAILLLYFSLQGDHLQSLYWFMPITIGLLCSITGLQNSLVTKASGARLRTTHITGVVTDIGIDLGHKTLQLLNISTPHEQHHRSQLRLNIGLSGCFFIGALYGGWGMLYWGFICLLPLALILLSISIIPLWHDIRVMLRRVAARGN